MADVFVAAGSNVDPIAHLSRALHALGDTYGELTVSPAYRNAAVGFTGEDFINIVVAFRTDEPVQRVRARLQEIEAACGRPPAAPKWAPRTMDLDILLYGDTVSDEPGLLLPRPDLARRPYMLKPMADIAPERLHPTLKRSMRDLWESLDDGSHAMTEVTIPRYDPRRSPGSGR
jgi:2-amino-4-hydroxy-6-hydroxymethyldihydropteridine diphosphokinase